MQTLLFFLKINEWLAMAHMPRVLKRAKTCNPPAVSPIGMLVVVMTTDKQSTKSRLRLVQENITGTKELSFRK